MTSQAGGERQPQLRGERLREHILWVAKEVFLESGYDGTSMDVVAARAQTSKRSLYAHFENKDKLFFAVLDFARELYLKRLKTPDAYSQDPHDPDEAVAVFCGRFLQLMVWEPQIRTCRLTISVAERLPGSSTAYFEAIFVATYELLGAFLADRYGLPPEKADERARGLLDHVVLPRFLRTLLNVDEPVKEAAEDAIGQDVDLGAVRAAVAAEVAGW